jgi:thiamine pyrophosphate-dependent acetolactate synthase large subunit-like protein
VDTSVLLASPEDLLSPGQQILAQKPPSNPAWLNFSRYAQVCGAFGVRVTDPGQLDDALTDAIAHDGPALVEVMTDPELV